MKASEVLIIPLALLGNKNLEVTLSDPVTHFIYTARSL